MLCITIAKLGGCREGKMITFPASFRSSNYNCHTDDLVSEVHSTDHVTLKGYKLAENPTYAYNAKPADMGESTLYESYNQATGVRTFVRVENDVSLDLQ